MTFNREPLPHWVNEQVDEITSKRLRQVLSQVLSRMCPSWLVDRREDLVAVGLYQSDEAIDKG